MQIKTYSQIEDTQAGGRKILFTTASLIHDIGGRRNVLKSRGERREARGESQYKF